MNGKIQFTFELEIEMENACQNIKLKKSEFFYYTRGAIHK
jgi:hypothetical protein